MRFRFLKDIAGFFYYKTLRLERKILLEKKRYVMCYHRVLTAEEARKKNLHHSMWITPESFERQICWMKSQGEIVSVEDATDFSKENTKPWFAITFDDGWLDNLKVADAILEKHAVPYTIFIVTGAVETGLLFWADQFIEKTKYLATRSRRKLFFSAAEKNPIARLISSRKLSVRENLNNILEKFKTLDKTERETLLREFYSDFHIDDKPLPGPILSWKQVQYLDQKAVSIQSHTHSHEILEACSWNVAKEEVIASKAIIERQLKKPCKYFCYPNARFDVEKIPLLEEAGYEKAFIIHNRCLNEGDNPYLLPRFLMCESYSSLGYLICRISNVRGFF